MKTPSSEVPEEKALPTILEDVVIDVTTLKDLRMAYRELRAAYLALHSRHHARILDALADLKEDGKKTGGDVPYGYRLADDQTTLVEDAPEQNVIAEVVRLRAQGKTFRGIAQELWRKKLRPRVTPGSRRSLKSKSRGWFDPTQLRRMIEAHKARTLE